MTGCAALFKQQTQARTHSNVRGLLLLVKSHGSGIDHFTWTSQPPTCPVQVQTWWGSPEISKCKEEELQRLVPSRYGLCEEQAAHKEDKNAQWTGHRDVLDTCQELGGYSTWGTCFLQLSSKLANEKKEVRATIRCFLFFIIMTENASILLIIIINNFSVLFHSQTIE